MKRFFNYSFIICLLLISIDNAYAIERTCVICGEDSMAIPSLLPTFVSRLITLVQILVPIILIVSGLFRYVRAVASGEDKVISEVNKSFIKSIIGAVSIFLIVAIVKFAFGLIDNSTENTTSCVSCFIKGNCSTVVCPSRNSLPSQSTSTKSCYQCNSNGSVYKWATNNGSDSACPSGYHEVNIAKSECK